MTYLNEKMDGVFFPLALLALVAGLTWQVIDLVIAAVVGLLRLCQMAWNWTVSLS